MTSQLYDVIVTSHDEKVTFADKPCTIGAYLLWSTIRKSYAASATGWTSQLYDVTQGNNQARFLLLIYSVKLILVLHNKPSFSSVLTLYSGM